MGGEKEEEGRRERGYDMRGEKESETEGSETEAVADGWHPHLLVF